MAADVLLCAPIPPSRSPRAARSSAWARLFPGSRGYFTIVSSLVVVSIGLLTPQAAHGSSTNSAALTAAGPSPSILLRPGESCSNPIEIGALPYVTEDSTTSAANDFPPGPCLPSPAGMGPDLVYRFELHSAEAESIAFYASPRDGWDLALTAMGPSCSPAGPCIATANHAGPGLPEMFTLKIVPFQPYYLVIDGVGGDRGSFLFMVVLGSHLCSALVTPPLVVQPQTQMNAYHKPAALTGGKLLTLITQPLSPCRVQYKNRDLKVFGEKPQHSWSRSSRFKDNETEAEANDWLSLKGTYTVLPKHDTTLSIPCTCDYKVGGRHELRTSPPSGEASGFGQNIASVQPFFNMENHRNYNFCASGLQECKKDTGWIYVSPLYRQNVPTNQPQNIDLVFHTEATVYGNASAYTELNTFRLWIECPDPPADEPSSNGAAGSAGSYASIEFQDWRLTRTHRPLRSSALVSVPPGFSSVFLPVDSTDRVVAIGRYPGSGTGVYLTRNIAAETDDQLATADTSRILTYAAGVFSDFTGPIYAPSALQFDPFGRFGSRLFVAAADSFEIWSGAPIRGRGVLRAVNNGGAILSFVQNLDSPVGLAFAPAPTWDGNLYVAELESGTIDRVTPAGQVTSFVGGLGLPMDLAFGDGAFGQQLYIADADSAGPDTTARVDAGRIVRSTAAGAISTFVSALHRPTSIARSDPAGLFGDYLYVTLYNLPDSRGLPIPYTGRVVRIDPLGNITVFADSLEQPMDLAFTLDQQQLYVGVAGGLLWIGSSVTAVDPAARQGPTLEASPNPFTTRVAIRFTTPRAAVVDLEVFDLLGRRVAKLANGPYGPGPHEVQWTGDGMSGKSIPAGIYWIRLRLGSDPPLVRSILRRR